MSANISSPDTVTKEPEKVTAATAPKKKAAPKKKTAPKKKAAAKKKTAAKKTPAANGTPLQSVYRTNEQGNPLTYPEACAILLACNQNNRPLKSHRSYTEQMLAGNWQGLNGEALIFGQQAAITTKQLKELQEAGLTEETDPAKVTICDSWGPGVYHVIGSAQHRLAAFKDAEEMRLADTATYGTRPLTLECELKMGVKTAAFDTFDTGVKRTPGDVLYRNPKIFKTCAETGEAYSHKQREVLTKDLATALRMIWKRFDGVTQWTNLRALEILSTDAPSMLDCVEHVYQSELDTTTELGPKSAGIFWQDGISSLWTRAHAAFCMFLAAHSEVDAEGNPLKWDEAERFIELVVHGDEENKKAPVNVFRSLLRWTGTGEDKIPPVLATVDDRTVAFCNAWAMWCSGENNATPSKIKPTYTDDANGKGKINMEYFGGIDLPPEE